MPETRTVTLYTFAELSEKAKERVRDDWRKVENETFDADTFKAEVLQETVEHNFMLRTPVCHFSLSYSQGDGVAFYGDIDLDYLASKPGQGQGQENAADRKRIVALIRKLTRDGLTVTATSHGESGHYHHWNSMRVEVEVDGYAVMAEKMEPVRAELQTALGQYLTAASRFAEKIGYQEIEYRDSAEVVDGNITANNPGACYHKDGRIFKGDN